MITFSVWGVRPPGDPLPVEALGVSLGRRINTPIEAGAANAPNLVNAEFPWADRDWGLHPLVAAAHTAFARHHPLVLSPDDIWLCIAQGFGIHLNEQAELVRPRIVQWAEGKREIAGRRDGFLKGSPDLLSSGRYRPPRRPVHRLGSRGLFADRRLQGVPGACHVARWFVLRAGPGRAVARRRGLPSDRRCSPLVCAGPRVRRLASRLS